SLSLYRLLRALAAIGVLHEQANRTFSLTALGESLRSDISSSKNAWARLFGRPMYYQAWSGPLDSLRTGEPAFNKVHGMSVFERSARRIPRPSIGQWQQLRIRSPTLSCPCWILVATPPWSMSAVAEVLSSPEFLRRNPRRGGYFSTSHT